MNDSNTRREANRANAQHSTGPRTEEGLAIAAGNALSHGLTATRPVIPGESFEDWRNHLDGIRAHWMPIGAMESTLVERIASLTWRMRRVIAYETAVTAVGLEEAEFPVPRFEGDRLFHFLRERSEDELKKVKKSTQELEENCQATRELLKQFEEWTKGPAETPLTGGHAVDQLEQLEFTIGEWAKYECCDVLANASLLRAGIPREHMGNPQAWSGWTVQHVLEIAKEALKRYQLSPLEFLQEAVERAERALEANQQKVQKRLQDKADQKRRRELRAILPDQAIIDKVMRFEAHLGRQLQQTLNALERIQATRLGQQVPVPAAGTLVVDVVE